MINKFINIVPEKLEFHASCSEGLDEFLLEEAKKFQLSLNSKNRGGIFFSGKRQNLFRFFLSSRFASRITFTLKKFTISDVEELYETSYSIPWERVILPDMSYRIESFTKDLLGNSRYALYKLKDGIQDRIRDKEGREAVIDRESPDLEIVIRSNRENVSLGISMSPKPMNKRGYRLDTGVAPIRETLAQALLEVSGYDFKSPLLDPMCGSGTILIEAALYIKQNGYINLPILKNSFVFTEMFREELEKISLNGEEKNTENSENKNKLLVGYDINKNTLEKAKKNIQRAGVSHLIHLECRDIFEIENPFPQDSLYIVTNPPYGERMGELDELKEFYFTMGKKLKNSFSGSRFTLICGEKSLLGHLRLKADREKSITISNLKGKIASYEIQ